MKEDFVKELCTSSGEAWREVSSKVYSLQDIIDYLQECKAAPQEDTQVYFTIKDSGDLYISTMREDMPAEIEGSGFNEIQDS